MKILAPNHIKEYCTVMLKNSHFKKLSEEFSDEYATVYQLQCKCGCFEFNVFEEEYPTVYVECEKCKNRVTVYDLSYYPAARKSQYKSELVKVKDDEFEMFEVCVLYEYGDDYEGNDDISWCTVWLYNPQNDNLMELISHETSQSKSRYMIISDGVQVTRMEQ